MKSEYVGVDFFKPTQKWRARITFPNGKRVKNGKIQTRYKYLYVGTFDTPELAAAAREAYIESHPDMGEVARNEVRPMDRLWHENVVRDPLVSPIGWYFPDAPGEKWETIPNYEADYHVSNLGRVRVTRNWGTAQVKVDNDTVVLSRAGRIRSFKVSALVSQCFPPN